MDAVAYNPILAMIAIPATLLFIASFFIIRRYKVVENNEILIIESWMPMRQKLRYLSGGGTFIIPLFESYTRKSLIPMELNLALDRVMTKGNIPLGGKIFAQVVIDDSDQALNNVAKHLTSRTRVQQMESASEILNGVLRETVANLTPEEVLENKDMFKEEMLKNTVVSLAHMGFKIKTLNIQEISDHVNDGTGYIAQLMRPRGYRVDRDTRVEVSEAESNKVLKQNDAHKAMRLQQIEQDTQSLEAEMNYQIEQKIVKGDIQSSEVIAAKSASYEEVVASLGTQTAKLEALTTRLEADKIQKAIAKKDQLIAQAKAISAKISQSGNAEVKVLEEMLSILKNSGTEGLEAFLIDNLKQLSDIFTDTIETTSYQNINIIEGTSSTSATSSALNPENIAVTLEILKNNGLDIGKIFNKKTIENTKK